ncbi:MAG: polyribonucleotide nucleotidyltransferase [Planctomycetota bacterium]|nr:polyribonucleotide nucleotidyltransferase [Planctomycetota bacterium]MDI6786956.1 polyribonucleotide nucleotidyltransferase [Planctomycetota bacterium]
MSYKVETEINGRKFTIETGYLAQLAHGSAVVSFADTVVLATCVRGEKRETEWEDDMLPLTVDYREKTSAAGKIPGGFFKREGRPTTKEILTMRLVDRPLRPLFPPTFRDELQIMLMVLSADDNFDPDVLAINAASAALTVSDIPFNGPIAAVRIGKVGNNFIINPSYDEIANGEMDMVVAGSADAVVMVEGGAKELPEDTILSAISFAHKEIKKLVEMQVQIQKQVKPVKITVEVEQNAALYKEIKKSVYSEIKTKIQLKTKSARKEALNKIKESVINELSGKITDKQEKTKLTRQIGAVINLIEGEVLRELVLDNKRIDGRSLKDIRPISGVVGFLPRNHGSALFMRGETQALVSATLGSSRDEQIIDGLAEEYTKHFMLHYNFPPFSVGEIKPLRGPGRREIGHGNLAERALSAVVPSNDEFPYTIRIVSDILQSNGSSSMATVCGAALSLMDAGVPLKKPVAGIAMGLVKEGNEVRILSDILGAEDHMGDMDFKVAGTTDGITAVQMDIKTAGLSEETIRQALAQAREGRIFILGEMQKILSAPRQQISQYAPRFTKVKIPTDKIGALIGPGGKNIKKIQAGTGATIEIQDDGTVLIYGPDEETTNKTRLAVENSTASAEVGKVYQGKVTSIKDFGAFVEILPSTEGMVHISELSDGFVKEVGDVVKLGDTIEVKVIAIDDMGKVKLSRRALLVPEGEYVPTSPSNSGRGGPRRPFRRDDNRESRPRR